MNYVELLKNVTEELEKVGLGHDENFCKEVIEYAINNSNDNTATDHIKQMITAHQNDALLKEAINTLREKFGSEKAEKIIEVFKQKNGVVNIKPTSDEQLIINMDKIKSHDIQNIFSLLFNQVIPKIIKRDKENGYITEEQAKFFTEAYNLNKFNAFINNAYGESIQDKYYCPQYTSDNNSDEEDRYITEEEAKSLIGGVATSFDDPKKIIKILTNYHNLFK